MLGFLGKHNVLMIKTPFDGDIVDITEVNDVAFSNKMVGDGFAVIPENNIAVAPCDGRITTIFPTNHALGITTKEGLEVLVHIGIDTVKMKGKGFKRLVEVGSNVKKGKEIIEIDLEYIKSSGMDTITSVVITNMDKVESMDKNLKNTEEILKIKVKK